MRRLCIIVLVLLASACASSHTTTTPATSSTCTVVFKAGTITPAAWASTAVPCSGSTVASAVSTCPRGQLVSNDYGHGYVGKPWRTSPLTTPCQVPA